MTLPANVLQDDAEQQARQRMQRLPAVNQTDNLDVVRFILPSFRQTTRF